MTSSVPGRRTVNVKPVRSAKSRACRSRSPWLASSDMPATGGQPQDSKPGVARMCAMLDVHAAWSDSLCCAPSATRWNPSTLKAAPGIVYRLASRYQLSIHVGGTARWHRYVPLATPFACTEHSAGRAVECCNARLAAVAIQARRPLRTARSLVRGNRASALAPGLETRGVAHLE